MNYIVPEYYKHFQCKCGNCRSSCCDGWPIRISMKEYFQLLGVKCSDELRSRLDIALKVNTQPSNECYGQIATSWQGLCMLHREDGLCALQSELGEHSLSEVCKRYPRNTKGHQNYNECSCSNSCEQVVELLMEQKNPLQFHDMDLLLEPEFLTSLTPIKHSLCQHSISLLQSRSIPLPERLLALGNYLYGLKPSSNRPTYLSEAFKLLHKINQYYENSRSISDFCQISQNYYGTQDKEDLSHMNLVVLAQKHQTAANHLEQLLPDWQIILEQLLVNHMFYNSFPYADNQENVSDAFLSLVCVYSFLKFNLLGNLDKNFVKEDIADIIAAMFRVIEHSGFKYTVVKLARELNPSTDDIIPELIYI